MKVVITPEELQKVIECRHELHRHPELAEHEVWTRQYLYDFVKDNTSLELHDMGPWFYAIKRGKTDENAIAFRAEFDALPIEDLIDAPYKSINPGVAHKCGHDGHTASLCGMALLLDKVETERTVYLIFQYAEEVGIGGWICADFVDQQPNITEVYGWHNRSGLPLNHIVIKSGSLQCASKGFTVAYKGAKSHASEPEKGLNPAFAIGEMIRIISEIPKDIFEERIVNTIVNVSVGTKDFGVNPGEGEINMTIRANLQKDLEKLEEIVRENAIALAEKYGLKVSFESHDPFPEVFNDEACTQKIIANAKELGYEVDLMDTPWTASDDFGCYTLKRPGALFFVGGGEGRVQLHNELYDFNDEIMETALRLLMSLID